MSSRSFLPHGSTTCLLSPGVAQQGIRSRQRVMLDAHNLIRERPSGAIGIERALSTGCPSTIEQDIYGQGS